MSWHTSGDVDEFLARAGDFLRSRPVENTMLLTLADTLRTRGPHVFGPGDPIFGWWTDAGGVRAAFLQTPPWPVLLTAMPPGAVAALVELLAGRPVGGVNGLVADAEEFAATWNRPYRPGMQTRLYRLDELTPPDPGPPGAARVATAGDRRLLIGWLEAFHLDIGEVRRDVEDQVDDKLAYGGFLLWEVDGQPVALAGRTRPEAGMVRVIAVYTPPDLRGRGFGGAATVAVTRAALAEGATDVVLFTDRSNPTSNALYQRLGYRPVQDRTVLEFESSSSPAPPTTGVKAAS